MAFNIDWNVAAEKFFFTGVDRGVFYPRESDGTYITGFPWEGLISVSEKPGGAEPTELYANNTKYATLLSAPTFAGSIEAYTYPDEFNAADGIIESSAGSGIYLAQQARVSFGFSYRTYVGSEAAGQMANYQIHVVYGATVQPSEVSRSTINDSPEAATFSWEFETTPAAAAGFDPVSHIVIDTRVASAGTVTAVEEALYGTDVPVLPALPLPADLLALIV